MNPLLFQCPTTGRDIEVGIEINYTSLRNVQPVMIRLLCPFCESPHEWKLSEGWIKDQPTAEAPQLRAWSACRDQNGL
jgi:hypothetical protein